MFQKKEARKIAIANRALVYPRGYEDTKDRPPLAEKKINFQAGGKKIFQEIIFIFACQGRSYTHFPAAKVTPTPSYQTSHLYKEASNWGDVL